MNVQFRTTVDELKERLQVFKTAPEATIVENFVSVESALKVELDELVSWFAAPNPNGEFPIDPAKVPRTKARMLIRSMFSYIEGIAYSMKQMALSANRLQDTLSFPEKMLCKEMSIDRT